MREQLASLASVSSDEPPDAQESDPTRRYWRVGIENERTPVRVVIILHTEHGIYFVVGSLWTRSVR